MIHRFDVKAVEKAIKLPAEKWKGRCFEIASAMVKAGLVEGVAVYGHWTGEISRLSHFADRRKQRFTNHGWVLMKDGTIVDPTRWVFEAKDPYIYVGRKDDFFECDDFQPDDEGFVCSTCGHVEEEHESGGFFNRCKLCHWPYDEGGNELRSMMKAPPPEAGDDPAKFSVEKYLSKEDAKFVRGLFGKVKLKPKMTWKQAHWLATLPYEEYEGRAHRIYTALRKAGSVGLVPIDNEDRAKREAA